MKNFFTSVRLPRSTGGELGQCIAALAELISQLRITVNQIDLDNMTPELRKRLDANHGIHYFKSGDAITLDGMEKGDIVIVYEPSEALSIVSGMYVYTGEGLV